MNTGHPNTENIGYKTYVFNIQRVTADEYGYGE